MTYFICRRSFRDAKGPISTGSVLDPVKIKRFKFRLQEGHIVEVTEQNFKQYATLFRQRYGINIPRLDEVPSKESEELPVKRVKKAEAKTEEVPVAKAAAKVEEDAKPAQVVKAKTAMIENK